MTAKGHVLLASAIGISGLLGIKHILPGLLPPPSSIPFVFAGIIFGSLLPDIDEERSYIGNKFKIVSVVIGAIVKHRTFTHYLILPALLVCIAFFTLKPYSLEQLLVYSISVGMILHDIGDMLTETGIRGFFYPLFPNTRITVLPRFMRFTTFSVTEYLFIGAVLVPLNIYLFLHLKELL